MTMCVTVHVIKQPEKSLSVQLTLVWGLDIPAFLNVECIAWYLVWFATPTSRKPHLVLPSGVMEYLVRVETGDEGSCTYSRFLWVNMPPEVPDTDLRTSEGAQESSPRIKNIIVAQCFHWRRFYTITEGNGFSFVTSLTSFLTLHTCPCWFHFYLHFSLQQSCPSSPVCCSELQGDGAGSLTGRSYECHWVWDLTQSWIQCILS